MEKIEIDKIIRSKRRTFGLRIGSDAALTVRAPIRADIKLIEKVVAQKAAWITKKQSEVRLKKEEIVDHEYHPGELFYYLGKRYPLLITDKGKPLVFNGDFFILSEQHISKGRELFIKWYKAKALSYIDNRVSYHAKQEELLYKRIRISSASKRWGSCSAKGNLSFSWRLILAPPGVIDYVVVHELAHLKHQNHAPSFWSYVESISSDYKELRIWLNDNGHLLRL